jgi:hypothetical protein
MKLRLPSDLEGGLLLFVIVVGITAVQLYFFSKVRANLGEAKWAPRRQCEQAGGKWIPNEDTNDPCCKDPDMSYKGPTCGGGKRPARYDDCDEACRFDPNSGFCTEACTFAI